VWDQLARVAECRCEKTLLARQTCWLCNKPAILATSPQALQQARKLCNKPASFATSPQALQQARTSRVVSYTCTVSTHVVPCCVDPCRVSNVSNRNSLVVERETNKRFNPCNSKGHDWTTACNNKKNTTHTCTDNLDPRERERERERERFTSLPLPEAVCSLGSRPGLACPTRAVAGRRFRFHAAFHAA